MGEIINDAQSWVGYVCSGLVLFIIFVIVALLLWSVKIVIFGI